SVPDLFYSTDGHVRGGAINFIQLMLMQRSTALPQAHRRVEKRRGRDYTSTKFRLTGHWTPSKRDSKSLARSPTSAYSRDPARNLDLSNLRHPRKRSMQSKPMEIPPVEIPPSPSPSLSISRVKPTSSDRIGRDISPKN
ncbi:hypothetical protein PENTCL1PPCAC_19313, partial [Pristionchus entomophagus]